MSSERSLGQSAPALCGFGTEPDGAIAAGAVTNAWVPNANNQRTLIKEQTERPLLKAFIARHATPSADG
eukprot:CAMPEP_0202870216 /NCGR_PEP_ID=MMETSP1391-20130828/15015_1 /ASSEMBLY_ACC=CAM_ASM_000867 /TAXON_ID=1034604 /ORGANISM="Chlamydomonas leiostraca, Strain SAG 11-49" /LENGTH=68 /DNA_ID=CAMNT_0049550725 /DNA_START=119 /DNA_END=321 /DNA_ORIENTATION=+